MPPPTTKPSPEHNDEVVPQKVAVAGARNPWIAYVARRLTRLVVSVVVLVTAAYLMVRLLPGDPARLSLGADASAEQVLRRRAELGLDDSWLNQYFHFWERLFHGDLGISYGNRLPVFDIIVQRMPATLELAVITIVVILVTGIPLGMLVAELTRGGRKKWLDTTFSAITGFFTVAPVFVVAAISIFLFAISSPIFPVAGRSGPSSYVLPVLSLALPSACAIARIVRAETFSVLEADFVRTARSKRISKGRLYLRHILANLVTPTLTMAGLILGGLIAGSVFVETVFAWPGMGSTVVGSIADRDYSLVQGIVLVYGGIILLINLIVDLLIAAFDPRSRITTT
ncbi:peptide/nickel transport system permease protein [Arthrobacter sp. yr096]|nr:peptide/nickel transport system permease protein [Arthrobacter sp. yr096]